MLWDSAAQTHVGHVRACNEDAYLSNPHTGLWAIADGMGGHTLGEMASAMVVHALSGLKPSVDLADFVYRTESALLRVNEQLYRDVTLSGGATTLGSTVVVLLNIGSACAVLWAGDSRLYVYRQGALHQLTRDHSLVSELYGQGRITLAEVADHPQRHVITRAVGAGEALEVDVAYFDVRPGDVVILASDGFYNEIHHDDICTHIRDALKAHARPSTPLAESLMSRVLAGKAPDNVSLAVNYCIRPER